MNAFDLASYFLTVVAIAIAPGPVVLMLMVRSASNDTRGATGFGLGYAIGGVIIISLVCFGLGAWLTSAPMVFEYSKYALMAYICYLAYGIWKGGFDMTGSCESSGSRLIPSIAAGISTCFISPYMMILFPLVLPEVMDITAIEMPGFLVVALSTFAALAFGSAVVVIFAAQLRRLATSPRAAVIINRSLSSVLVCGGGVMAFG